MTLITTSLLLVVAALTAVIGMVSCQAPPTVADCNTHRDVPFADPLSCTGYYQCFLAGTWELIFTECPPGSAWDDNFKSCSDDPSLCQEATTPPPAVTTPPPAVTTPPPAVTTAPPPGQTTAAPPTTQPPITAAPTTTAAPTQPPGDNPCPAAGVYPNPANCQAYYRCVNLSGRLYKYDYLCPSGSYFSSANGRCIVGACTTSISQEVNNFPFNLWQMLLNFKPRMIQVNKASAEEMEEV